MRHFKRCAASIEPAEQSANRSGFPLLAAMGKLPERVDSQGHLRDVPRAPIYLPAVLLNPELPHIGGYQGQLLTGFQNNRKQGDLVGLISHIPPPSHVISWRA